MWAKVLPQKEVLTVITREGVLFVGGACCSGGGGTSEAKHKVRCLAKWALVGTKIRFRGSKTFSVSTNVNYLLDSSSNEKVMKPTGS
jgi:hypothetical protein